MAHIIIADPLDTEAVEFARKYLTGLGHRIDVCERGDQVLELLEREQPQVIIAALMMPGADGLQILSALDKFPADCRPRLALRTTKGAVGEPERAWNAEVAIWLCPPVNGWQLVLAAEQLLCRSSKMDVVAANAWVDARHAYLTRGSRTER